MYPDICNNLDLFQLYLDFLDIKSICQLLSVSKQFTDIMNQSKRTFQPIICLPNLPHNSILFENICYFQIKYKGRINDVPTKENETHLICFKCIDKTVTDVSALGNVHTLDLEGCTGITDVSALGNVHTLYLRGCKGITDVSALGNVHSLDLKFCNGITDVSALGNVHSLNLSYCRGITYENIQLLREHNPTIVITGR